MADDIAALTAQVDAMDVAPKPGEEAEFKPTPLDPVVMAAKEKEAREKHEPLEAAELHELTPRFYLWYHPFSSDRQKTSTQAFWDESSYQVISVLTSIEEFYGVWSFIGLNHLAAGYFFVMREGVFPTWEHSTNIEGGEWTVPIDIDKGDDPYVAFQELSIYCLSWNLTQLLEDGKFINGVTLAPKTDKKWVMKIWNNDSKASDPSLLTTELKRWTVNPSDPERSIRYRAHKQAQEVQRTEQHNRALGRGGRTSSWRDDQNRRH